MFKNRPRHALNAAFIWRQVMIAFPGAARSLVALVRALGLSRLVDTLLTGKALGDALIRRRPDRPLLSHPVLCRFFPGIKTVYPLPS